MVSIKIDSKTARTAVRLAPKAVYRGIQRTLQKSAIYTQRQFRVNMPVGASGLLRNSVQFRFLRALSVQVEPKALYADAVEKGTRPHHVPIRALSEWARFKGLNPYAVQKSIARHGTRPHPFEDKTYNEASRYAFREFNRAMQQIVDREI